MVFNDLYDKHGAQLGPYGLAVYMALCRYANREDECWPSYARIAKGTGVSRRQIVREIQKMESLGIIEVGRTQGGVSVYILLDTDASEALPSASEASPGASGAPPTRARLALPGASGAHRTRPNNKNYLPDELTEVIIR